MAPATAEREAAPRAARGQSTRRRVAAGVALLAVAGGGALYATAPRVSTEEERTAQDLVIALTRQTAMASYSQDIGVFARAAAAAASGLTLIGVDDDGGFGHLTFAATLDDPVDTQSGGLFAPPASAWDPGPYCFRVTFDAYGKVGEFGTADGIALVSCPDALRAVEPPPRTDPIVPPDARDVAHAVLAEAPDSRPDADDLAAQIDALLPAEVDGRPVVEPTVTVDGADIGIALGSIDDCVLVARIDGAVTDVYPPSVYLQPGELGCTASTALADLRPPH